MAHTAVATAAAIEHAGATPVFVDVDPLTYTLDPALLEGRLTRRTKAIVPVHLYGHPAQMGPVLDFARRHGLPVVEDCAQAHGARYEGRLCGTMGQLAAFSFYPTKNLGAYGDGGAVVTGDGALAERVRRLREYGWTPEQRYVSQIRGTNSRLDELQAAILRVKLRHLEAGNARRRRLADRYGEALSGVQGLTLPVEMSWGHHVYHLFVVRVAGRRGAPGGAAGVLAGAGDRDGGALPAAGAPAAGVRRPGPGGVAAGDGAGGGGGALPAPLPRAAGGGRPAGGAGPVPRTSSAGADADGRGER